MRLIDNLNDINNMVNTKKTIEQYLVLELLDHFNSGILIKDLREMARNALEEILKIPPVNRKGEYQPFIKKALEEENFLGVWKRLGKRLEEVHNNYKRLTASEISDIIRFFGTVIEKGRGSFRDKKIEWTTAGKWFKEEDTRKESFRVGSNIGTFDKDKYRLRGKTGIETPKWMENLVGSSPETRGIAIKAALDKGVLGKIENTFGLWKGAAISGTTADTIYFFDKFGIGMDPLLNLLPVATLTYNYHHSLLEVAMMLTMNNRMTYSIASYTSLMPHRAHHPSTGSIEKILKRFEDRIDNKRMLNFYSNGKIAGCLIFDREDFQAYKDMAVADLNLWKRFAAFGTYPTDAEIATLNSRIANTFHFSKSVKDRIKNWENKKFV